MKQPEKINYKAIPDELKALDQWVWWKGEPKPDGKLNKKPMDAKNGKAASHSNPKTWASFDKAQAYHESHSDYAGIGFVFSEDDPYVGIDLDNCRNPETGEIATWAWELIQLAKTYSEVSPSGKGVKLWIKGKMPGNKGKRNDHYETGGVEMYPHHRFFTVTGQHLDGTPLTIAHNTDAIVEIIDKVFAKDEPKRETRKPSEPVTEDDKALIQKAKSCKKNGAKFTRLWNGDTREHANDHSRADLALCSYLAFWTQGDIARIDKLFRQSGLMREKWEREDYRTATIQKAIEGADAYDPSYKSDYRKTTSARDRLEEPDEPEPPPSYLKFPESAFRGIFEVYLEAVKGRNEVCDSYHFAVLKTVIGSIIGRGAYLYTGSRIYPNFYTCLIGATGISRKTTALSMGRDVLQRIDPNVITFNGLATPEGLIAKLTIPNEDDDDDEKFPDPTLQPRIDATSEYEGFRTLVGLSEYAALLKKAKKSSSDGLIQVLTDAYDCPPSLDNPTRHSPLKAVNPCMSIVALSTQSWLEESLNLEDIRGGFANRFCYYLHDLTPPVPRPTQPDEKLLGALIENVHKIREYYQKRHIEFNFDDETGEFVDNWYGENRQTILTEKNELVRDTMQRLDSNARKLALLYAILDNDADDYQIHLVQFETALKVATYWKDTMQQIFGLFAKDVQVKNEAMVLKKIRRRSGITRREIQQQIGGNISAKDFNTTIAALLEAEVIYAVKIGSSQQFFSSTH